MEPRTYNLAIETSSRHGSVAVGRGDELLETAGLADQRRHAVELLPAIDRLAGRHGFGPADLAEVYVSMGPGSFTGLRVGVTVAKMLARATGCRVVAVASLDVVAGNVPVGPGTLAVCLNAKGGRCFTGFYQAHDGCWRRREEPALLSPPQILARGPEPLAVLGDWLPEYDWPATVRLLDPALAVPRASMVWHLGRRAAVAGRFADPARLTPLYVRLPEAEEKWRQRQAEQHSGA